MSHRLRWAASGHVEKGTLLFGKGSRDLIDPAQTASVDGFIGRRKPLATLMKLLDGGHRKRSALVKGPAGVGKTRLVEEFLEEAGAKGFRVVRACCYQREEAGAFFALTQILSQLDPSVSNPRTVLHELADDALRGGRRDGLGEELRLRRSQMVQAIGEVILRASEAGETIVCVEDIQWGDIGTLLAVNSLLDVRHQGLVIVCTARNDESPEPSERQLISRIEEKSQSIALGGFSHAEVREFVGETMHPVRVRDDEVRALRTYTGGNPMFLGELIRHLNENASLERHSVQEALRRVRLPDRLAQFVGLRLDSLPEPVRRALSGAAIIGTEFSADAVAELLDERSVVIEDRLADAVDRGFLRPLDGLEAVRFRFSHPLFAASLYDSLKPTDRRALHRRLAERARRGDVYLSLDEVARHYALGFGVAGGSKAIEVCRQAAEAAETLLGFESAARYWELALRCTRAKSTVLRAELCQRLGWALWAAAKWTEAAKSWKNSFTLYDAQGDRERAAKLALALGDLHAWRFDLEQSRTWLEVALDSGLDDSRDRARALALLGSIRCRRGEDGGLELLAEASDLQQGQDPKVAYWLAVGFGSSGQPGKAREVTTEGFAGAQRREDAAALGLFARSLVDQELGRLQLDSARAYGRIVETAVDPADGMTLIRSLVSRTHIFSYAGRWDRVRRLCERWMAQVRLSGPFQVASARVIWAEAQLALGEVALACGELERALPDLGEIRPVAALHLARALLRAKDAEAASALVRLHSDETLARFSIGGSTVLGDVAAQIDAPDLWTQCYEMLGREQRPLVIYYVPISTRRVLGRLASRLKLWPAAFEHFEMALSELSKGGARWEHAQTLLNYAQARRARNRRGDATKADALTLQAEAAYEGLGIPFPTAAAGGGPGANRYALTGREIEVLELMARGSHNHEIAEELTITPGTVARHIENILNKTGASNRVEAIMKGVEAGLVGPLAGPDATKALS